MNTLNTALNAYNTTGVPSVVSPVTVFDVLIQLKMDPSLADDEMVSAEINAYIETAIGYGENETRLTFRTTPFIAYWDQLYGGMYPYEVRRGPLKTITGINYNVSGEQNIFDISDIEIKHGGSGEFSRIQPKYGKTWPVTNSEFVSLNNAELLFTAGYGVGELPAPLKTAIMMHVAALWSNRGDCGGVSSGSAYSGRNASNSNIPAAAQAIYRQHSIVDLWMGA